MYPSSLNVIMFVLFFLHSQIKKTKPTIVVTFSVLEDFAKNLLKNTDHFEVQTIVKNTDDPHVFMITPKHYVTLQKANILIENGLGFEPWLDDMIKNVQFKKHRVVASKGVIPMRFLKNIKVYDPHAWLDVTNAKIYVKNIAKTLVEEDPKNKEIYLKNEKDYLEKLDNLHLYIQKLFKNIHHKKVITTHDGFWYFGKVYHVEFSSPLGISTEEEPSSFNVAQLIKYIRQHKIKSAFLEAHTNNNLVKKIAEETNIKIGGTVYIDSMGDQKGYIEMMEHNALKISESLYTNGKPK